MITKRFLNEFIKKFEHCKNRDLYWNTKLFEKSGSESWSRILIERSSDLRKCFEINEQNIESLSKALEGPLTDEEYHLIADAALKIYQDGFDDICVFPLMLEPCIAHFYETKDLNYLLPLLHAYAFEIEQADIEGIGKPKYRYEEALAFKDQYANISSRYARLALFKSYSNIVSRTLNTEDVGSFSKMYGLYQEALGIYQSEACQKLDGGDEEFEYFVDRMLQTVLLYENIDVLTPEERHIFERLIAQRRAEEGEELDYMTRCIDEVLENHEGRLSSEELVMNLLGYFDDVFSHVDVNGDPNEQEDFIDNCYNIIATLILYLDGKNKVGSKRADIIERMNRLRLFVKSLPYTFFNSEMNRYAYMLYQKIRPFMSYEDKKEYLLEVVMFRQPITCIHSLMVASIATKLGGYLLDHRPELFIGVLDAATTEEVGARKPEILKYIHEAAIYHDVGKVSMVDVINTQNRRLTDVEFAKIKTHPDNGLTILDNDADFAKFYDVIRGHHKWYDGSRGYPESFDNVSSKVRIVIDIVTIADCTDSATDVLGRNYAKGKTFRAVLQEFLEGAGTRYNPDIAKAIAADEKLIDELTRLTTEGRFEIYKEVYSRYIN